MIKITETDSKYRHLEKMTTTEILHAMNAEDKLVPQAIELVLEHIESLVNAAYLKMAEGGRLFYIGSGTSGRLGIVDASECPPTFGVPHGWVIGIISGGDGAIRKAVEFAEDDPEQAWKDLEEHMINQQDLVVGISASGTTPYVLHGLKKCQESGITTGSICCNPESPISQYADYPIEVITGPEFLTGSTRLKAGTAQKLILNMITTGVMIKLGRVMDNKMVDMQLSNNKLVERGTQLILSQYDIAPNEAKSLLLQFGSVRSALNHLKTSSL